MRWNKHKLFIVTGKKTIPAQVKWFQTVLGAKVPYDGMGVVMNDNIYDALVKKHCGLVYEEIANNFRLTPKDPKVRLG